MADLQPTIQKFVTFLIARRGLCLSTVELIAGYARRACTRFDCTDLTHDQIDQYIVELRLRGASYANQYNAARAMEHYSDFLGRPLQLGRPRKPSGPDRRNTLTEAEVAVLISRCDTLRKKAILSLLAYSGIRNRELCALRVRDVDIANQTIHVELGKGAKSRTACIGPACVDTMVAYLEHRAGDSDDPLFLTRSGRRLAPQDLRKLVRVTCRRAGITKRVSPHLFRHSLATNLYRRGAGVLAIQAQLGHVYLSTTTGYLHLTQDQLRQDYRHFVPSYM